MERGKKFERICTSIYCISTKVRKLKMGLQRGGANNFFLFSEEGGVKTANMQTKIEPFAAKICILENRVSQ